MAEERSLSVTEAMSLAKGALETVRVSVIGEVSEFNDKPGYKAAYFTVADAGAAMPCMMWRDAYEASGVTLRCGALVEMTGHFSAYAPKGRMQFSVRRLALAGEGRLRMQVAELASRLEAEGLMRPEHKRSLSRFPERIAVVTSPRGKAVHDVLRTLRRRYPLAEILVAGVPVEGDSADVAIAEGLRVAAKAAPDVVLLVRGGGSYEDLMPFNSEVVARAVAGCAVPVVTGIGHEPDTSIADMVADLRASTPTAAAEAVAPSLQEVGSVLAREHRALSRALEGRLSLAAHQVNRLAQRPVLSDVRAVLGPALQAIDMASMRLARALPGRIERDAQALMNLNGRFRRARSQVTEPGLARLGLAAARLEGLSPLSILARGYSASFAEDGKTVIVSVSQVTRGDRMIVRVSDGRIGCTVGDVEVEA